MSTSARSRAALRALVARSGVVPGRGPADSVRTGTAGTAGPSNGAGSSGSAGSSDAGGGALTTQHVDAVVLAGGGALTVAGRAAAGIEVHDDFLPVDTQADVLLQMERARWSFTGGRPPNSFWRCSTANVTPRHCLSAAPMRSQGAPGGSGQRGTPRKRSTGRPASASGARASRFQSQSFHGLLTT